MQLPLQPSIGALAEELVGGAELVGNADNDAFAVGRRNRSQREHMMFDNIGFQCVKPPVLNCVFQGDSRVAEAMPANAFVSVMPVIEEVVVKQGADKQTGEVTMQMELADNKKTDIGDSQAVHVAGGISMLDVVL